MKKIESFEIEYERESENESENEIKSLFKILDEPLSFYLDASHKMARNHIEQYRPDIMKDDDRRDLEIPCAECEKTPSYYLGCDYHANIEVDSDIIYGFFKKFTKKNKKVFN